MLDLTALCGTLYEIKLADGQVYQLKRPTQALYETIIKIGEKAKEEDGSLSVLSDAMDVFVQILNRNTNGRKFTKKELQEDYDFTIAMMVMSDYMKFYAEEIQNRANFQVVQ